MRKCLLMCCLIIGFFYRGLGQTNVQLLHQLVDENKSEFSRQEDARNRQAATTANEAVNRSEMDKLKTRYRQLQNRFKSLGMAISAAQIGLDAAPIVSEIITQQGRIFDLAWQDPLLLALAYDVESDLAGRAYALSDYLYGLSISLGDLDQMKGSDRKMLFGHVVSELRKIAGASKGLAISMYYAGRRKALAEMNPFAGFINQDKRLVEDIIRKTKSLSLP